MSEITQINPEILSSIILQGDISKLNPAQRVEYVTKMCERVGVDPLTQPFRILKLQGKEVLYADKGCSQQLCKVYKISTEITSKEKIDDVYIVTTRAKMPDGRYTDEDGAVAIAGLKGNDLANALMKANTKSKRRAVLALCGLGLLDESEIETIKGAQTAEIEMPKLKADERQENSLKTSKPEDIRYEIDEETCVSEPEVVIRDTIIETKTEDIPKSTESIKKPKTTIKERLAAAKGLLGEFEYNKYLELAGIKEEDITEGNIKLLMKGMKIRYEELKSINGEQ